MCRQLSLNFKLLAVIIGGFMLPLAASANDGMAPSVFEMIQADQDVKIVLKMADSGEPGTNDTFRLVRNSGDESVTVFTEQTFSVDDAVYTGQPECRWFDGMTPSEMCRFYTSHCDSCDSDDSYQEMRDTCNDCNNDGENDCWGDCVQNDETGEMECQESYCSDGRGVCSADCDGDGTGDCDGWCQTVYHFEIIDVCVAPGDYQYEFSTQYPNGDWDVLSWIDVPAITVTESDMTCSEATVTDSDEATDTDIGDSATAADTDEKPGENTGNDRENDDIEANDDDAAAEDVACSVIVPGRTPWSLIELLF